MSARSRLIRLCSATVVSAFIAGAAMLTAPTAFAADGDTPTAEPVVEAIQSVEPTTPVEPEEAEPGAPEATEPVAPNDPPAPVPTDPGVEEDATVETQSTEEPQPAGTPEVVRVAPNSDAKALAENAVQVTGGSLEWGIKKSFVDYVASAGSVAGLGSTAVTDDHFVWNAGSGSFSVDGTGSIAFPAADGVHFEAHGGVLDLGFTHPRIELTSSTTGNLYLDVAVSGNVTPGVHFATLTFAAATGSGAELVWSNAAVLLTADGAAAFNGMYQAGTALDPMTFSTLNSQVAPATATATVIESDKSSITEGDTVTLAATVSPAGAAGTIQFFSGTTKLGTPVTADSGSATLTTSKLPVGNHEISAQFTPNDPETFASSVSSNSAQVRVLARPAGPTSVSVANATLSWGVKESFRNYLVGPIAHGSISTLGSTTQARANGVFSWSGGTGTAMSDGSKANVAYGSGNGIYLRGHGMTVNGEQAFALDMALTNPRIVITSATKGEIRMDVSGREFVGTTSVGPKVDLKQAVIATLELPAPSAKGKTLSWANVPATLTAAGSDALGGFYNAGEALDPVTFSFNTDTAVTGKKPTSTTLTASATSIKHGGTVTLTAAVKPGIAGTVAFSAGGKQLGGTVATANGLARTSLKPADGVHSVTATFTPKDSTYGHSVSNSVKVTVEKKPVTRPDTKVPANGAKAAGSLSWGVSTAFADYVTGPIAKGSVSTSGVGSSGGAYLFPQASGGSWNSTTQTGSVQYSGTVTYTGHHGLLREGVSNPMIQVTGPTTAVLYSGGAQWATLDLGAATKSVGSYGEVTWSGVPVNGGFSGGAGGGSSYTLPADGLSFTVGAASGVSYGSTSVSNADKKRTVAETAPTTTGIRILTAADQIAAGSELEFEAVGFEPGEREMIVAMYPGPIVLDEAAGANDSGTVRWLGTLPEDLTPGEYTITLQGSTDAGAVITVADEQDAKVAKQKERDAQALLADGVAGDALTTAGIAAASTGPVWLWWAGAGALLIIAAAMGGLVALQRRAGTQS